MIKLDDKGLVPAIVQDAGTGRVLTLAYMNEESLERTRASGQVWFYSRSPAGTLAQGRDLRELPERTHHQRGLATATPCS